MSFDHPGRINLNMPGRPLKRDWLHCNSLDHNAASSHIVINSVQGELDTEGHFFEVTAAGELVWEYIHPVTRDGAVKVLGDILPMTNSAFRAYRYAADHPALQGRNLTPKGTITERAAQGLDARPKRRPPTDRPQGKPDGEERRGKGDKGGGRGKGGRSADGGERPPPKPER